MMRHPNEHIHLQWAYFIGALVLGTITGFAMYRQAKLYGMQIADIERSREANTVLATK